MEHDHLVVAMAKMLQASHYFLHIVDQVADENNQAAPLNSFGKLMQDAAHIRVFADEQNVAAKVRLFLEIGFCVPNIKKGRSSG
jgi:hypothetical protein